jgi:hypothetical protein
VGGAIAGDWLLALLLGVALLGLLLGVALLGLLLARGDFSASPARRGGSTADGASDGRPDGHGHGSHGEGGHGDGSDGGGE